MSVPFTASQPKTSWGRQRLSSWLLGWWESLQSPSVPQRTKAKGNTRPMTPTLTDLSCTLKTTTMMRTRTAVEKVRLFKREGGREGSPWWTEAGAFWENKSVIRNQTPDVFFPLICLSQIRSVYLLKVRCRWQTFLKDDSTGRGVRETVYEASMPIWTCLKSQTTEAFFQLVRDDPSWIRSISGYSLDYPWEVFENFTHFYTMV